MKILEQKEFSVFPHGVWGCNTVAFEHTLVHQPGNSCAHLFRFLMEASLHRLDWLKSLVVVQTTGPSALPRDQRMRLKFPSLYSYLVPLATSHQAPSLGDFFFSLNVWCGPFLEVFVEFVTITLLSYGFWFFLSATSHVSLLAPPPTRDWTSTPALEGSCNHWTTR